MRISLLPGFTGSILPGISIECASGAPEADRAFWGSRDQGVEDHNEQRKEQEQEEQEEQEECIENALQAADNVVDIMMAMNSIALTADE